MFYKQLFLFKNAYIFFFFIFQFLNVFSELRYLFFQMFDLVVDFFFFQIGLLEYLNFFDYLLEALSEVVNLSLEVYVLFFYVGT